MNICKPGNKTVKFYEVYILGGILILAMGITPGCQAVDSVPTQTPTPVIERPTWTANPYKRLTVSPTDDETSTATPVQASIQQKQISSIVPLPAVHPINPGWIAFASYGYGYTGIDIIRTDGTGWRRVTNVKGLSDGDLFLTPTWSPDGQWIAFIYHMRDKAYQIYRIRADGSGLQQLTFDNKYKISHSWSPKGNWIAFSAEDEHGNTDIYLIRPDGSQLRRLTSTPEGEYDLSWSPHGKHIAFMVSDREGNYNPHLAIMDSDGDNRRDITGFMIGSGRPAWSPDGRQIVFRSTDGCGDLYKINIDGSGLRRLANLPGAEKDPTWSPDGLYVAFSADKFTNCTNFMEPLVLGDEIDVISINDEKITTIFKFPKGPKARSGFNLAWSPKEGLQTGLSYLVTEAGAPLNLRDSPQLDSEILEKLSVNTQFEVLMGPVEEDEFLWWRIRTSNGKEGWVAEIPGWFR